MRFPAAWIGIVSLLLCRMAVAEDSKPPTTQPIVVSLADEQALKASMGKEVLVEGTVTDAQWSATGRVFLIKFKEGSETQFQGAFFSKIRDDMEKAFNGDLSNAFEGAKIQIKGKLQTYRELPEILIDDPKQITILVKGPGKSPHAGSTPRPSVMLYGVYGKLTTLTDEQRQKIAAIQKEAHDAELAYEKKIRDDADARIVVVLTDAQKLQLKSLQEVNRQSDGD